MRGIVKREGETNGIFSFLFIPWLHHLLTHCISYPLSLVHIVRLLHCTLLRAGALGRLFPGVPQASSMLPGTKQWLNKRPLTVHVECDNDAWFPVHLQGRPTNKFWGVISLTNIPGKTRWQLPAGRALWSWRNLGLLWTWADLQELVRIFGVRALQSPLVLPTCSFPTQGVCQEHAENPHLCSLIRRKMSDFPWGLPLSSPGPAGAFAYAAFSQQHWAGGQVAEGRVQPFMQQPQ